MRALYKRIGFKPVYAAKARSTYDLPVAYAISGLPSPYIKYLDLLSDS